MKCEYCGVKDKHNNGRGVCNRCGAPLPERYQGIPVTVSYGTVIEEASLSTAYRPGHVYFVRADNRTDSE